MREMGSYCLTGLKFQHLQLTVQYWELYSVLGGHVLPPPLHSKEHGISPGTVCQQCQPTLHPRFVKFSMPSIPNFNRLFSQAQFFIITCKREHICYAIDTCQAIWFSSSPGNVFHPVVIYISNILLLLCLIARLCHQLTDALVERKQPLHRIGIFRQAINKIQMNTNQVTSVRTYLCQQFSGKMF